MQGCIIIMFIKWLGGGSCRMWLGANHQSLYILIHLIVGTVLVTNGSVAAL